MSHEITIQQAADRADQANVTLLMLRRSIEDMDTSEIETAVNLAQGLIDYVSAWLIEEQSQREAADAK
ncbi:hypothetical protein [Rahnella sp. PCH160]|uniref:hypothetical protein n=1 Tax=Rahnella sp. PCH160 TaxID=3447928 RepID=UPI0039FC2927